MKLAALAFYTVRFQLSLRRYAGLYLTFWGFKPFSGISMLPSLEDRSIS
jgi:hypothetical protein